MRPLSPLSCGQKVQVQLRQHGHGGAEVRNKYGALLRGLLYCAPCGCAMTHTYTAKGNRRYRYYACAKAQKNGWDTCPAPSVPAAEIERFVVDQIRIIGHDPALVRATLDQLRAQQAEKSAQVQSEADGLRKEEARLHQEMKKLAGQTGQAVAGYLADLQRRLAGVERRGAEIRQEMQVLEGQVISDKQAIGALAEFDRLWNILSPREQAHLLNLLLERVEYDGHQGTVALLFRPTGIKALAVQKQEAA